MSELKESKDEMIDNVDLDTISTMDSRKDYISVFRSA